MRRAVLFSLLCMGGIGFSAGIFGPGTISKAWQGGSDFPVFYTGGALAFSPDLYHIGPFIDAQKTLTDWTSDQLLFSRMPWEALLLSPLALLPFHAAHAVWAIACLLGVVVFISSWPDIPLRYRAVAACWSVPLAMNFIVAQDVPLLLAALGCGFLLLDRGRDFAAGLCISLCMAVKPHIFWPLGMMFASHRMWRCILGMAAGGGVLAGISFAVAGRGWVSSWVALLLFVSGKTYGDFMPTLHAALLRTGAPWLEIGLIVLLVAMVCLIPDWKSAGAVSLIVGVVAARHAYLSDCALTLPALFLVWNNHKQRQILLVACSPPVSILYLSLGRPAATGAVLAAAALAAAVHGCADLLRGRLEIVAHPRLGDAQSL